MIEEIEGHEQRIKLRARRRRPADHTIFTDTVSAVISDALHRLLQDPEGRLMASRSKEVLGRKRDRYGPPLSKQLPGILDRLVELGWLTSEKGHQGFDGMGGRQGTFAAGERLRAWAREAEVAFGDLGRRPGEEVIILKRGKEGHFDEGGRVDYEHTEGTRRYRSELEEINAWIAGARLGLDEGSVADVEKVDLGDRTLRRVFNNGRFDHGGRLYGGFWVQSKAVRSAIRFSATCDEAGETWEPGVELDYGQASIRILYGLSGAAPPSGDLYAVPGLEGGRDAVKAVATSLQFGGCLGNRYPRGSRNGQHPKIARAWSWRVGEVRERLLAHHAPIKVTIQMPGVGFRVWQVESRVLVAVLLRLKDAGIVALPIHDAVVVPSPHASSGRAIMANVFREVVGVEAQVNG